MGNTTLAGRSSTTHQPEDVGVTAGAAHTIDKSVALSPRAYTGQTIAISGSSQQTTAITATEVDITADTACFVAVGTNPTAALNTSYRIPATQVPIRLGITSGDKIAVIGTSGNAWVHPVGEL